MDMVVMDMTKYLRRWLNDRALADLGDSYEGRIHDVVEQTIRNRFTAQKQLEPVIVFEDGWKLIPNINQRRALVEFWGPNTEDWVGRRLVVYRLRLERVNASTGVPTVSWEKRVALPNAAALHRAK